MTQDSNEFSDATPSDPEPGGEGLDGLASVILIDRREDIGAICGRIDAAPTYAVVLHAPRGNRTLASELGMRRLRRHAEETGKLVAIATGSGSLAGRARQVGLPAARRPHHVRWDAPGRRVVRVFGHSFAMPQVGRFVQLLVVALLAAGVGWGLLAIGPSAEITVQPPTESLSKTIVISARPGRDSIDFNSLAVPASKVSATQRITLALRTTGKVQVGTKPAKIILAITNPTGADIAIAAGAEVTTSVDGVSFTVDQAINVPKGQSINSPATAIRPGTAGNLPPGSAKAFVDPKLQALTVANSAAATGGANEERPAVDAGDIVAIKALAKDLGTSEGVKSTLLTARPHDAVFLRTAETSVEAGEPNYPVGTPIDLILLPVDVKVTAVAVLASTLEEVARYVLQQDQGEGEFIPGSVSAVETGARQSSSDDGTIRTEIVVKGEFARKLTRDNIADAVRGKSEQDARSTLAGRYGIQNAQVDLSPGWAPWLPRFAFRINVVLKSPPAPTPTRTPAANAAPTSAP